MISNEFCLGESPVASGALLPQNFATHSRVLLNVNVCIATSMMLFLNSATV